MHPEPGAERTEGTSSERRLVLRVVEAINLAFLAVELGLYGAGDVRVLGGRALVALALGATDLALSRGERLPRLRPILAGCVVALVAGFGLLVAGSGGAASPYFGFMAFLPIVLTIVVPDEPALPLAAGLSTTALGLGLELAARAAPARLGFALAAFGSCAFYGTASALLHRRMRRRARAAAAARAEALAALAQSEKRRLEAERLAAVGRLAAGFSHEISNPLASASANLRFVQAGLARGAADPEVAEALHDAHESLERLRGVVADLRPLTFVSGGEAIPTDLGVALGLALRLAVYRLGPSAQLARDLPADLPQVWARPEHLAQVLLFLVAAAGERSLLGGGAGRQARVAVTAAASADRALVEITIRSAAAGPAPAAGPAGGDENLGLTLSRELVEPWGGAVEATVGPGAHAGFVVRLHAAQGDGPPRQGG